jgi:hypothetical protein
MPPLMLRVACFRLVGRRWNVVFYLPAFQRHPG